MADLGNPVVSDRFPSSGPLGGLEAALEWSAPRPVLVLACDLPYLGRRDVERLIEAAGRDGCPPAPKARAWVATAEGDRQPLIGLYSPGCLEVARDLLIGGERAMKSLLARVDTREVFFDPESLVNLNSQADLVTAAEPRS